jgi:hypothetical protein
MKIMKLEQAVLPNPCLEEEEEDISKKERILLRTINTGMLLG